MTHLLQLSPASTLELMRFYGRAYERSLVDVVLKRPTPTHADIHKASVDAAAEALRYHRRHRPRSRIGDVLDAEGLDILDGFVVTLATIRAGYYARQAVQRDDADDVGARVGKRLLTVTRSGREGPWRTQPPIPPSLGEWVKTAVRFELSIDARYRSRHPEDLVDAEALVAGSQERGAFEMESNTELEDVLERAQDALTAKDRQVVFMLSRLEMSQVEVSRQLKVTPQAVNQRLTRIKKRAPQLAVQLAS